MDNIVLRAQKGDREAVAELYDLNHQLIYNYINKRVGNANEAEDLTSKVFLKMIERLHQYKKTSAGGGFTAWLYRIAYNTIVDEWRKNKRPLIMLDDYEGDWEGELREQEDSAEDHALIQIDAQNFKRFLDYCTPQQAEVIELKYVHDLSNEQIADRLDTSVGAVKSMQHRAFDSIRTGLEEGMAVL